MTNTQQTENPGVVAVTDDMAIHLDFGAIVWWRLGGQLPLDKLEEAWDEAGQDSALLPKNPSPVESMTRAVRSLQSRRQLARPLGGRKGWALVTENPTQDDDLEYETVAKVFLDGDKHLQIQADPELTCKVQDAYNYCRTTLAATDVSLWLSSKLIGYVKAIKLRDTGGIYFIPRQHMAIFRKWAGLLRGVSDHVIYEVPALQSDEAVEAIMAALMVEADGEITAMETELDTEDLGKRAIRTRETKCEALRAKLETYAELLGVSMEATNDRLEAVQATLVEATLVNEGDSDG